MTAQQEAMTFATITAEPENTTEYYALGEGFKGALNILKKLDQSLDLSMGKENMVNYLNRVELYNLANIVSDSIPKNQRTSLKEYLEGEVEIILDDVKETLDKSVRDIVREYGK